MPLIDPDFEHYKRSKPSTGDKFYQSAQWRRFRKQRLEQQILLDLPLAIKMHHNGCLRYDMYKRSEPLCTHCILENNINNGTTYDHIIPRSEGGADYPPADKMQWLCFKHHQRKRASENVNDRRR